MARPVFENVTFYDPYHGDFSITSAFGGTRTNVAQFHTGIDLVGAWDKKVIYPIYPGEIIHIGYDNGKGTGYGNIITIYHGDLDLVSRYAHLKEMYTTVGEIVGFNTPIGLEGTTGNSTGRHLHLEFIQGRANALTYPSGNMIGHPEKATYLLDPSLYLYDTLHGQPIWRYSAGTQRYSTYVSINQQFLSQSETGKALLSNPVLPYPAAEEKIVVATSPHQPPAFFSTASVIEAKAVSTFSSTAEPLLTVSKDEKKYGPNVVDLNQPIIKRGTSESAGIGADVEAALRDYSRFMYNLINSSAASASAQVIAMPWLRPGNNVWLDPARIDKVYYLDSVSHQGSRSGVFTNLSLSSGRERLFYEHGQGFGSIGSKGNLFLSEIFVDNLNIEKDLGEIKTGEYHDIQQAVKTHALNDSHTIEKALNNPHYSEYYDVVDEDVSPHNTGTEFSSIEAIQSMLTSIYEKAPLTVRDRRSALEVNIEDAKTYIREHYSGEVNNL